MTVKIVTDSVSNIPQETAESLGITIVPLYVQFGTESYRDRVDMSTEEFYQRLANNSVHPKTSAGSPGELLQVYQNLLTEEVDKIISIHTTSVLSAVYEAAVQARDMMTEKQRGKIEVIDSALGAMALGLLVIAAAKLARKGKTEEEIIASIEENKSHINLMVVLQSLEYLKRGGRVPAFLCSVGEGIINTFHRLPVLTLRDGKVAFLNTVFNKGINPSQKKEKIIEFIQTFKKPSAKEIALEFFPDGATAETIRDIENEINLLFPKLPVYVCKVSPVIGTHVGPGAIIVSLITK